VKFKAKQLKDDRGRFLSAVDTGLHKSVMEIGAAGAAAARNKAPVRTGRLRAGITSRMIGAMTALIESSAPYSIYQDEGTGPKGRPGQYLTNREDFFAIGPVAGTPASHFMAAGMAVVRAITPGVVRSNLP